MSVLNPMIGLDFDSISFYEVSTTSTHKLIGASISEPHTSELNGNLCVCVCVCVGIVYSGTCSN